MHYRLFESRILALENDYTNARRELGNLLRILKYNPESVDPAAVRLQLSLLGKFIQLAKTQRDFYIDLGEKYDIFRFHKEFIEEFRRRDPILAVSIVEELDRRWRRMRGDNSERPFP